MVTEGKAGAPTAYERDRVNVPEHYQMVARSNREHEVALLGTEDEGTGMRLPDDAHTSGPWRVREFTRDFRLYDVWALPTPGGPDDFPRLVRQLTRGGEELSARIRVVSAGRRLAVCRRDVFSAGASPEEPR